MKNTYALGWSIFQRPYAGTVYGHTGTTQNFNAAIAIAPEAEMAVVVLTNSEKGGKLFKKSTDLLNAFAKANGNEKAKDPDPVDMGSKKKVKTPKSELANDAGYYVAPGAYMKVYQKRKKLFMKIQGLRAELVPVGNGNYILKPILLHLIPIRINDGRIKMEEIGGEMVMTQIEEGSDKELIALKYNPTPIATEWKSRLGEYEIVKMIESEISLFDSFELSESDNLLLLSFKQASNGNKIKMVLEMIDDERATVVGLGRYAGQSVYFKNGELVAFGLNLRKISK
jgi:hypothetical protein